MSRALPDSTREFLGIGDNVGRDNFAETDPSFGRREDAAPFPMPGNPQNVDLDSFDDKTRKERASVFRAAAQELFKTDVTKLDDAGAWGLYHAVTESMFGLADEDGSVAFGKRAAKDPRQNIDMLRRFVKGEYTLIEDPEYTKWREMNDEEKFKYALENETIGEKVKSNLKGERGASFWEMAAMSGMSSAPGMQLPAEERSDIVRRSNYETLTDEEKEKYRADVVADYDEKLSRRQTLATFLQFSQGLSDRASWMLAKSFNDGVPDSNIETLPEDERDRVYSAFSLMRGDQKKGQIFWIDTDFTDGWAWTDRLQMMVYGFQQSVLGLFSDTWGMTKDTALAIYAKTALSESERKDFFDWWNAQARMEQAMKQNLPEAESFFGEAFQGVAENLHWFIPYSMIGKGGKMVTAARGLKEADVTLKGWKKVFQPLKDLQIMLRPMPLGGTLKGEKTMAEASKAIAEAQVAATKAAYTLDINGVKKLGDYGKTLVARQMAAVEHFTQTLRGIDKDLEAAKWWKDAAGTGMWAIGEAQAFSAFASEYVANADAAGISREESVLTAAAIGLINAKIEKLYVPGLEASLSPAQIKSLTFAAMAQAIRSDGAAGFRKWLANRVAYGVREGVKVAATEGLVEEPLQQMAIEHGKAFDKLCQELRENGNATAANEAKALWDSIVATLPQDYATFIDTAADMLPSSIGFGVTTIGNMTRRQHIQNVMVRHANRRAGSTSTMGTAQSMEELMGATDYDAGVVDMIQRAVGVRNAMEQHWQGEGGEGQNNPHRFEEAITAARQAFRNSQGGDVVREVAQAAGVDVKTAEVLTQYLQVETEAAAFSPTVRAMTALNMSLADIDEQTIKTILPGYVEGSFAADPEAGVYSGKVKLADGSERTIAYKVGDISEELMKQAEVNSKVNSAFGRSWDARIEENNSRGIVDGAIAADMTRKWAELSDQERYMAAVRAQASVNGFSSGTSGVFELTDAKGEKVRVNADDIIYLASGRIADIGYGAAATQGTVRHETFHSLWRFARASLDDADVQALAKTLGVDVTKDGWEVELDEKMAHQMERYASGHYVSHAVSSRFDKMLDGWAGKLVNFFGKIGQRDEVLDPNTGKPYQLKNLYDRVLRGELGSGALGVELAKIPEQPAGEAAATKSAMPVEVTDAERAAAEEELRQGVDESGKSDEKLVHPESAQTQAETATVDEKKDGAQNLVHSSVPVATSEDPADASTPNQRYYRVGLPNSNVKLVGRLEVRDAETGLVTSTDADYHDRGNQNRDDKSEESRALVEKIGANPDPLQVGTVQPIASNGIVWALPNGDVIIGNHRVNGVRLGYEKGTTGELERFVREDAAKRGIEIGENVKKPLLVFVLERVESPDGKADVHEVVRLANESQNRGFNVREQAANDAKILVDNNLLPRMVFRADGRIDEMKSGDAIGKFRSETGAQGMIAEDGSLTEEGQTRLQNAALAALLGRGENAALLQKIMANAGRLDMQNELRALMKMTPELMSLAEAKPAYDLRGPLAEALQLFTEWRDKDETARVEKGKTRHDWRETAKDGHRVRGISWEQFMSQGDMFRKPSDEAKILGDLFARAEAERSFDREDVESAVGKKRAIDLISNYLTDYIENARAVNTETEDIFGGAPASRAEVMAAQRVNPAGGVRFSVDPAKVRPATKEEYDAALSTWGDMKIDAGNIESAGWIFPDGRVLKPKMHRTAFGMAPHHDSLFAFLERPERKDEIEKFEYGYADSLAGGAARLNLGGGGIEVMRLPTAEQLDTLYDALDAGYGLMEDEGEDVLRVDVDREDGSTVFTAQYRRGTSARRIMDDLREWFESAKVPDAAANARFSISGIYTGSAADYEKPSLHAVGTGEGSQVYGWGLYGSNVRGVAESYSSLSSGAYLKNEKPITDFFERTVAEKLDDFGGDVAKAISGLSEQSKNFGPSARKETNAIIRELKQHGHEYRRKGGSLYEQTWFTNREPGDESHLLKWYRPVEGEQRKWIEDALQKENLVTPEAWGAPRADGAYYNYTGPTISFSSGDSLYRSLTKLLGSPRAASEFLARAGIDGVKYPVDSYGKTLKNGDEAGWNYVAFSDENIRVDHKWTDGQQRFSIAQTRTPEFKQWFGDWEKDPANASKVVDKRGRPLVVYHDTNSKKYVNRETGEDWDLLTPEQRDEWRDRDDWDEHWEEQDFWAFDTRNARSTVEFPAFFFAPKPDPYHEYGERRIAAYLNMRNPAVDPKIHDRSKEGAGRDEMERLKAQGYDGIIRTDENGDVYEYAVFDANQIKSATDNIGAFDSANPDIRFSIYAAGKYAGSLRSLAHGIKEGDEDAIAESAGRMVALVPNNAVLVPIPGHLGRARTTMRLAQAIAALKPGVSVVNALEAEPHESNYDQKKRLHKPPKDVNMWRRAGVEMPEGRPVYFVDNVVASGSTYYAAQKAMPGADIITLADTMKQVARELPTLDEIDAISKQKKAALQGWREKYEANRTEKNFDSYTKAFGEYVDAVAAAYDSRHPDETVPHGRNKVAGVVYPDAGGEIENIRFSIGAKRREEYGRILAKYRPDLRADAILEELDKYDNPKKEKITLHWLVRGTIWLPYDEYKIDEALAVAEKAKVDPFKYPSPLELIDKHKDIRPTEKRIDPDTVPELSDKRDESDGVVSYQVQDDRAGQAAMRRIIDTHWGEDANPWCLLAREKKAPILTRDFWQWMYARHDGNTFKASQAFTANPIDWRDRYEKETGRSSIETPDPMASAWDYWENTYNALPKRVAFKNGKLLAFMATAGYQKGSEYDGQMGYLDDQLAEQHPTQFEEYNQWLEKQGEDGDYANFYEWLDREYPEYILHAGDDPQEEWWDRRDKSHIGQTALREIANPGVRYSVSSDLVDAMRRRAAEGDGQRYSINPNLRADIDRALAKRTEAMPETRQMKRHDEIVFSDSAPIFKFLGLPDYRIVSDVVRVRKIATKHKLSPDQIAELPNRYAAPVAVMLEENGFVVLTDMIATTTNGEQKPVRMFFRPTRWKSGEIVLLATALAENAADERQYYEPRIKGGLIYADKNKVAGLALEEETESILRTQASGDNVKTAKDFSKWTSTHSIPQTVAPAQGSRFSVESPGFKYPNPLNALSDDELIAAAVAARMALGKSDKISDRAIKINTVQQLMRRLHPDWTDTDIGRESNRIVSDARKLGKKIREDLDRGVSESLILEHLPDAAREQFGREMREEARKGQRLGVFAQRVKGEIEERQARMIDDAVRVQTGLDVANIENAYGINLSETIMHLAENPLAEKPPQTMNGSAGEESAAGAENAEGETAEGAAEIDAKVKAAVNDILAASRTAAEADERNRKDRRAVAGRAEERKAEAGESGDEGSDAGDALGEGDFLVNAVKKEGVDLENPRHLARFVAELARRQWIKEHGLGQNTEVWRDLVAVQFLRKTAQSVYAKLCRDLTYSRGRETAMQHIARFDAAPTVAGLMSEMEFVGALINARRIRDTQQQKCEQLDLFLRERFGAQGRFKPDKEEGKRKVSAEAELRARYMRHAMWLTPDAAAEEARQLQETLNALSVDFKDAGRDVDQSREFVETIRKLNVLREFGALRYKPIGDIDAAAQWWEDFERGSSDDIVREMSDRDIRTKKAAHLLALAFADPKRKTVREGDTLSDKLSRFITGHMGFVALLQDCMRFAPDADVAAVQDILGYISREVQKSGDRTEVEKRRHNNAFASAVESIYGKSFAAVMKEMATTDERFTEFMGEVGGKRVMPTKGRAMQLLVSLLQEGRKVQVEDEDNPGQMKTVWEGGYHDNIVKHKREGQAQKIMRLLTPADMNMIKWLGQWYEQNRSELSDVCKSLFGIGVYAELPNYFPVKMLLEKQGLEKGEGVGWTIFPKALTPRVKNERDFDTSADIFSMWASRMEEGAQWKHHAQLGLEMRGIFGRAELQAAVIANHGKNVNELMQGFITDILAGHGAYDRSTAGVEYFSDQIRGWTALCALGGNIGVMFKQTTSIPAFGFEIGLVNTAKYVVTAFTPEGMAAMMRIWDSEQRQTRWQVGSSEAIRNALMQRDASILKRLLQMSMVTTKIGDVVPALVVGQGIYRDCLERGMSDEDAMAETWSIIERTQQSGRMENQTSIQRRNKLGRLLFQFLSTQQQYLQYEAKTIREVIAKPLSVKRWQKMGSAIFLAHFILPTMYFWMGELYKACLGQEPPEDELKDWLVTCLLGPLGSLVVAGFCCKYTLERAIKGYSWKSPSMLPMESFMKNQINDASKLMEAIFDAEGNTWDEVLDAVGQWISDSNSTVRDLRKLYRFRVKEDPQNRKGFRGRRGSGSVSSRPRRTFSAH